MSPQWRIAHYGGNLIHGGVYFVTRDYLEQTGLPGIVWLCVLAFCSVLHNVWCVFHGPLIGCTRLECVFVHCVNWLENTGVS